MVHRSKKLALALSNGVKSFQRCRFGRIAFLDVSSLNLAALVAAIFFACRRKSSFLKKEAKNFCSDALITWRDRVSPCAAPNRKKFFGSFFKKEHPFLLDILHLPQPHGLFPCNRFGCACVAPGRGPEMGSLGNSLELMEENMKYLLRAGIGALALNCGVAMAQSATETTTTQFTAPAPVPPPPPGTLATTHTTRSVDAYGNEVDSQRTTYRTPNGVAQDSRTVTTTVPAPPPVTTTTTTTQSTTIDPN